MLSSLRVCSYPHYRLVNVVITGLTRNDATKKMSRNFLRDISLKYIDINICSALVCMDRSYLHRYKQPAQE